MNIAVISDIHLGRGDQADRKRGFDDELLNLLDYLESRYELIILLGDIWELLTPKLPGFSKRELNIVRAAHPKLAQRFAHSSYQYIVGNHDRIVESIEGIPKEIILEIDDITMVFTHGHQFDIWAHQLRYVGEFVVWISGWAARFGTQAFTRFFDYVHNILTGTSDENQLSDLELKLIQQSINRNAQVTVIGHTHLPGITEYKGHLLINSGHCLGDSLHFVSLDTKKSDVTIYRVNQSIAKPLHERDLKVIGRSRLPQEKTEE